jgi:hypothetical protein
MDSKQICKMYYSCKNKETKLCEKCPDNYMLISFYEDNNKVTCYRTACIHTYVFVALSKVK